MIRLVYLLSWFCAQRQAEGSNQWNYFPSWHQRAQSFEEFENGSSVQLYTLMSLNVCSFNWKIFWLFFRYLNSLRLRCCCWSPLHVDQNITRVRAFAAIYHLSVFIARVEISKSVSLRLILDDQKLMFVFVFSVIEDLKMLASCVQTKGHIT